MLSRRLKRYLKRRNVQLPKPLYRGQKKARVVFCNWNNVRLIVWKGLK